MKYAYRFMPLDSYDIDGLENWLMDMASKKGLFLIGITGNFFKFQRGEPKEVRYRMEAVRDQEQEEPDEEEKELYRASGWEYVATRQKNFYIFRADDKNAPELYTDPESLAFSLKRVKKRMLKSAVVSGIIILAAVGTILAITFSGEYPFLNAVEEGLWKTIWAFLLMIFGLLSDFSMLFSYRKINRRLKGEKPSESRKGRSLRTAWSYLFFSLVMVLAVGWYVLLFVSGSWRETCTVNEYAGPKPYLLLSGLQGLSDEELDSFEMDGVNWANFISRKKDFFVREYAEVKQHALKDLVINGQSFSNRIGVYYYDFSFEWMARRAYQEMFSMAAGKMEQEYTEIPLSCGADEAVLYRFDGGYQLLVLRQGRKAEGISYMGPADLAQWAEEYSRLLRE